MSVTHDTTPSDSAENLPVDIQPHDEMSRTIKSRESSFEYDLCFHNKSRQDCITVLHFNDVYNIDEQSDGMGGVSRFVRALRSFWSANPLILFSGDCFNPSMISTQTKGRHMVPFLNLMNVHTACFGNHDFDFGVDNLEFLAGSCKFLWVISNVKDRDTDTPLANGLQYRLFEWQHHKIAIIGLVEKEWLDTIATIEAEEVVYEDFVQTANRMSPILRQKGAKMIIALTHMRAVNDCRLANEAHDIDLILGGHDHEYFGAKRFKDVVSCKSGTDFREFTKLVIHPGMLNGHESERPTAVHHWRPLLPDGKAQGGKLVMPKFLGGSLVEWDQILVCSGAYANIPTIDTIIKEHLSSFESSMNKIVVDSSVQLDTRFSRLRTSETNAGNWLCDLMRVSTRVHVALLNSGTIRADQLFPEGSLKLRDLFAMLPMMDPLVVIEVTGAQIVTALENGVSQWPKKEGRFPQVAGMRFIFNPSNPVGSRIESDSITIQETETDEWGPIDFNRSYLLVTKEYIADGRDGYEVFPNCRVVVPAEEAGYLLTIVRNILSIGAMANGRKPAHSQWSQRRIDSFRQAPFERKISHYGLAEVAKEKPKYQIAVQKDGRIQWRTPSGSLSNDAP
eukprot:Platyproteum_vivax@DN4196_c0_g1_i3.p1